MSFRSLFGRFRKWLTRRAGAPIRKRASAKEEKVRLALEQLEVRLAPSITMVQDIGTAGTAGTGPISISIPVTTTVQAGHSIIVEVVQNAGTPTVTDSVGNVYQLDA